MFGRILLCQLVPKSQLHPNLWKGANRRFKAVPQTKIAGNRLKKPKTETQWAEKIAQANKKRVDQAQKLKELGYEFEAPELKAVPGTAASEEALKAIEATKEEDAQPNEEMPDVEMDEAAADGVIAIDEADAPSEKKANSRARRKEEKKRKREEKEAKKAKETKKFEAVPFDYSQASSVMNASRESIGGAFLVAWCIIEKKQARRELVRLLLEDVDRVLDVPE